MMKLELTTKFPAFDALTADHELADSCIIIGLNGAGKSRLLKGILDKKIEVTAGETVLTKIKLDTPESLMPIEEPEKTKTLIRDEKKKYWELIRNLKIEHDYRIQQTLISHGITLSDGFSVEMLLEALEDHFENQSTVNKVFEGIQNVKKLVLLDVVSFYSGFQKSTGNTPAQKLTAVQQRITKYAHHHKDLLSNLADSGFNFYEFCIEIEARASVGNIFSLNKLEFESSFPTDVTNNPFKKTFTDWFHRYLETKGKNDRIAGAYRDGTSSLKPFSNAKFKKIYGEPPWHVCNDLLKLSNMNFSFPIPDVQKIENYSAVLIDNKTGQNIKMTELSSGEKTLLSLLSAMTLRDSGTPSAVMPELILLDEPDAHLHASMTKVLMSAVENFLVRKLGMKVIICTHSPVTVAVSNDTQILNLTKDGNSKTLRDIEKEDAIRLLSGGAPSLFVASMKSRPVWVESSYDAEVYQSIFDVLQVLSGTELRYSQQLSFHSSAGADPDDKQGNDQLVKDHLKFFRDNGITSVYGVIDWDGKKHTRNDKNIRVMAFQRRYTLENVIFDPLVLAGYLLSKKLITPQDIGLKRTFTFTDTYKSNSNAEMVAKAISTTILGRPAKKDLTCEYVGGTKVKLDQEYLQMDGKKLRRKIIEIFNIKTTRGKLICEVAKFMAAECPELIPIEFSNLFESLQDP